MGPQAPPQSACSDDADDYRQVVLVRVHQLVKLGYERLDRSVYRAGDEEEISGDLADAIDFVLDDRALSQPGKGRHAYRRLPHVT